MFKLTKEMQGILDAAKNAFEYKSRLMAKNAPFIPITLFVLLFVLPSFVAAGLVLEIYPNTRPLSDEEIARMSPIFKDSVDYSKVRVKENIALNDVFPGITIGNRISFRRDRYDFSQRENQALLAHELTHVWQFQRGGYGYIWKSLKSLLGEDHPYVINYDETTSFFDYDVEEQGEIVAEYFLHQTPEFESYMLELQTSTHAVR